MRGGEKMENIRVVKKFFSNLFNVESADPESLQADILNYLNIIDEQAGKLIDLERVVARNLVAWDNSKDKTDGMLPEVYLSNQAWYEKLSGEEYNERKAIKKYNI